mgnify:CR=1 FL=1
MHYPVAVSESAKPLVVTVLFGGRSAEHDISLRSTRAVVAHLDTARYDIRLVGITRNGDWLGEEGSQQLLADGSVSGPVRGPYLPKGTQVVFPVLHGPGGEDGTIQGWLELLDIPCVGSGCAGSAIAMDKSVAKHVLRSAHVPVLTWTDLRYRDWQADRAKMLTTVENERGFPCFVKPARLGSSLGISRVTEASELAAALELAFTYGDHVLVEPAIECRELEIAVLDGSPEIVSLPGEILADGWYDFDSKYVSTDSAKLSAPTDNLEPRMADALRDFALRAFRVLRLSGMARVDFLLDRKSGRYYLNEVNSIPGFTSISMYPKLMEAAGVPFAQLCDRLIELALQERRVSECEVGQSEEREREA